MLVALTKDKKRVEEAEIKVVMGWSSTLYVTNFSESTKDSDLRTLFAPVGDGYHLQLFLIFDVSTVQFSIQGGLVAPSKRLVDSLTSLISIRYVITG